MPESGSTSSGLRSIAPGQQPVGHAAKRVRAAAEGRQGVNGLAVQATYLLLRRGYSEDGWVGRLASLAVGACRLAERCRIGEDVEQIVLDLEREPDRSREPGKRLLEPRLEPVHAGRAHHDAHPDQCTGLQGMHLFDLADTERAPLG